MPTSKPSRSSFASFSAEPDVPITFAPMSFASCSAATPTPDDAAVISSHSPDIKVAVRHEHVVHDHE